MRKFLPGSDDGGPLSAGHLVIEMNDAIRFILHKLRTDALPDNFTCDEVKTLVASALEHSIDKQSDLDEERITNLRSALLKIEETTTDTVAALTARQARLQDDD